MRLNALCFDPMKAFFNKEGVYVFYVTFIYRSISTFWNWKIAPLFPTWFLGRVF